MVANLNRAESVPWIFAAFEIFFRHMSEFVIGAVDVDTMLANTLADWSELEVPEGLVQSAAAQGQMQEG